MSTKQDNVDYQLETTFDAKQLAGIFYKLFKAELLALPPRGGPYEQSVKYNLKAVCVTDMGHKDGVRVTFNMEMVVDG